jgi:glycosyltransferase involved in cell wall biosynthesis
LRNIQICVVIPIKNEEINLKNCLPRLKNFAEVWVIDSGSEDSSENIARQFNAHFLQFNWDGRYPKKRNWFVLNKYTSLEWILFLDADEFVTPEFENEVDGLIKHTQHSGFWIHYTNHFLKAELKHGIPQRKLALVRNGTLYEKILEDGWSKLDMEVHEHPIVQGSVGQIRSKLIHNDQSDFTKIYNRHSAYALWEANRYYNLESQKDSRGKKLTVRQRIKYFGLPKAGFAEFYFFVTYIGFLGFLDGIPGLRYALLKLTYFKEIRQNILKLRQS